MIEKNSLVSKRKILSDELKILTHERDRAIEQKFINSNEINDPKKIAAQERYNQEVERKVLDEQRKFNYSKMMLDELKEKVEVVDRNVVCSNKKIEAVKREIEKVRKNRQGGPVQKPANIAKMFSSPPPVISNVGQSKVPTASRSGFLNFFRRN
jgi:septal ring factor EnvC (AmiA/AmiB activator)